MSLVSGTMPHKQLGMAQPVPPRPIDPPNHRTWLDEEPGRDFRHSVEQAVPSYPELSVLADMVGRNTEIWLKVEKPQTILALKTTLEACGEAK